MKPLLLALPIVAAATTAQAQDVLFRSGEHEDFTRLVATLPSADTDWTITGRGTTYRIKIEGDDLNLRTSRIFDRIPRTRLANVVTDDQAGEVELQLACDCRIVSIPYNERYVIFDIREGLPPEQDDLPQIPLSFGEAVPTEEPQRIFRFSSLEAAKPVTTAPVPEQEPSPKPDFSGLLALENFVTRKTNVTALRQDLIKQVDRAATQRLLDAQPIPVLPDTTPTELAAGEQFKTPGASVVKTDHVPPQAAIGMDGKDLNIVAYNVIDEVGRDIAALLSGQRGVGTCLPDAAVNIASWSGDRTFIEELAALRQNLVGEFDRTNDEALEQLAKLYIHYTFGAEALQALDLLPKSGHSDILEAMAFIVDGEPLPEEGHAFANQGHCSGHVALWAALAGEPLTGESAAKGAMDGLAAMPRHLREYLGPKLSNHFVEQGDTESATLVLNAIARANSTPAANFDFAKATLDAEMGKTEEATEALTELATENSDMATLAIIDLVDSHLQQGVAPASDTIALVGALAVEHKGGAMGPSLRRAHALARMLDKDFETAFAIVAEIEDRDGAEHAVEIRNRLANAVIEHSEDFDIISYTLAQKLSEPGRIKPDTALALAHKLFDLGFVGETRRLLQAAQNASANDKKRLLKARVALADALPRRAEAELMGMDSPEANRLRAKARSLSGDHEIAASLLAELGDEAEAEAENWLGGNLQALAASETEVYRQASTLFAEQTEGTAEGEDPLERVTQGMLSENRSLLEGSSEIRSVVDEILNWHTLSDPSS
ncbi:hypothetical protein [Shimia marina]|uniref:Uncharacterized protein n=1 Tax=Shimia marina TaxID=321267 RepID=A0A0P1ELR1_9RHOB|nr:hypothetical protein [Shimia marina]CUH51352.1 hypothetical protein SHM7688_00788 [Shimia marina]SFD51301.1 Uncharacterized conserved protein HemY, contains two TPR repeats [Shimia marina]